MLKLSLLLASAAAFQPRATKVQPKTVQNFGMLDGLFKKSEADVTETVYFDISIGGGAPPSTRRLLDGVVVRCSDPTTPKTRENFKQLCTGEKGFGYKGSPFHRIIPGFMCQGGDFTNENGTGGKSIYGEKFADENFDLVHGGFGTLHGERRPEHEREPVLHLPRRHALAQRQARRLRQGRFRRRDR